MATFVLEDLAGSIEVTVFPKTFASLGHLLVDDRIVVVRGRIDRRDDSRVSIMASEVKVVEGLRNVSETVHIDVSRFPLGEPEMAELRDTLQSHPGDSAVYLSFGNKTVNLGRQFAVDVEKVIGLLRAKYGSAVSLK
jgi:DNA polymerase-3 subunit alpha